MRNRHEVCPSTRRENTEPQDWCMITPVELFEGRENGHGNGPGWFLDGISGE